MLYFDSLKKIRNPYLIFLPFLFFYIFLVLKSPTHGTFGDEGRYTSFAQNLLSGFYSTPSPAINLWNGPGYPIVLIPFVLFHLPPISITLFNAVLYYFSIILLFKTLQQFFSFKVTLIISLLWACYINSYGEMKVIYCEVLTSFLICLLLYCLVRSFNADKKSRKFAVYAGLVMGYIVLTKVIFGYVILFMLIGTAVMWLFNRTSLSFKRGLLIMAVAFASITPYLAYTYHLTGKAFYLSNSGGMSLYFMSAPDENELGDWFSERSIRKSDSTEFKIDPDTKMVPGFNSLLYANHAKDYEEINKYVGVERDAAYKKIAVRNIKKYPAKYIKNCFSNLERLLFSFPYSYTLEHSLMQIFINGPIVFAMLLCLLLTILNWRKLIYPLRFILFFVLMYFGLTLIVSTYTRMFTVVVPVILFWMAWVFQRTVKISLKFTGA